MPDKRTFAQVIISVHVDKVFDYRVPAGMAVQPGARVVVNFRGSTTVGIIKSLQETSAVPRSRIKPLQSIIDRQPFIDEDIFSLARGIGREYYVSEGEALKLFLPGFLGKKAVRASRGNTAAAPEEKFPSKIEWVAEQKQRHQRFSFYKERIQETIASGGSALLCVPTVEDMERTAPYFKDIPQCTYSAQQPAKTAKENWLTFKNEEFPLCIGTRSAFFILPKNLRLIILDDCLSDAYTHPEKPFYTLSDIVLRLSRIRALSVILHGTHPSLTLHTMLKRKRVTAVDLYRARTPAVRIVDTQRAFLKTGQLISPFISEVITKSIKAGERLLIFYNRKGFSSVLKCASCKKIITCTRCSIPLKYYFAKSILQCPSCHKTVPYDIRCPLCGKGYLTGRGMGIERLQSTLQRFFPGVTITQWETMQDKGSVSPRIILATARMLSSLSFDFSVERAIALDIDSLFYRPDHDTSFRVFLLLQQLKSITDKELIVITSLPQHHALMSAEHDDDWFYQKERESRKTYRLPPYYKIVKLTLRGFSEKAAYKKAEQLKQQCDTMVSGAIGPVEIAGPVKEIPYKLRDRYYYSIILTSRNKKALRQVITAATGKLHLGKIRLAIIPKYE